MATPQTVIHGTTRPRDALVLLALLGLVMLHVWELPRQAAQHGGLAFLGAWLLGLVLLALPLLLLELMLGRRARRSPLEGLAVLTREADARRGWRLSAWGAALAGLLALAGVALVAGGSIHFLVRDLGVVGSAVSTASASGLVWPLGTGSLLLLAAGLSLMTPSRRALFVTGALIVVLVLLALAAMAGVSLAPLIYRTDGLEAADWQAALRLALLGTGSGLGVVWLSGMRLPREAGLGRLALGLLAIQVALAAVLLLALAPFVASVLINAQSGLDVVPSGGSALVLLTATVLAALVVLVLLAEPLVLRLTEGGVRPVAAVVGVFVAGAALAEATWVLGQADGLQHLLLALSVLVLLVLLGLSVFGGWGMKISHARKELALPAEGVYNLWRVAVRLLVPLLILWVLAGYFG